MKTVGIIGCGKMGVIILDGIVKNKLFHERDVYCYDTNADLLQSIKERYLDANTLPIAKVFEKADLVIICVKPNFVSLVLEEALHDSKECIVVSIAAGITNSMLEQYIPSNRCVRVMPNTPCSVGCGMSVICPSEGVPVESVKKVKDIFGSLGRTMQLKPDQMDAATALSGSGPGLVLTLLDGLADGGLLLGITRDQSIELVAQTMLGTAQMVLCSLGKVHSGVLRDQVCTPGGCTIAGIMALEDGSIRSVLGRAIEECANRARALGPK